MAITVQMIGEKEFKVKPHGYDQDEVDEFLDMLADEIEELEGEIQELNASLESVQAEEQAAPQAAPAPQPVEAAPQRTALQEESVKNMLINAQRVCDETIANAHARAEEMVKNAREQADKLAANAREEVQQLNDEMEAMRAAVADYRARFQRLIDDQAHILRAETELFKN